MAEEFYKLIITGISINLHPTEDIFLNRYTHPR